MKNWTDEQEKVIDHSGNAFVLAGAGCLSGDTLVDFRFRDQIRASSGSIIDNIAEGFERNGNLEFRQFLSISKGSAGETRSQLYRALDFNYITQEVFKVLKKDSENLSGKINNFITYLNKKEFKGTKFQ